LGFVNNRLILTKEEVMMKCDDCEKEKEDVKETTCPFAEEINYSTINCLLCDDCYHERCMDI